MSQKLIFVQTEHLQSIYKAPIMLTSAQIKSLVFASLTEPQQEAAAGCFSDTAILTDDEVAVCNDYLHNANELVSKFTLASANTILYVQGDAFKILSSPKLSLNDSGREIFIGHDGNQLFHPSPVSIPVQAATSYIMTLLFVSNDPTEPSALHALGAQHYVTETLTESVTEDDNGEVITNVTFPFPEDPEGNFPNFDQFKVAALPVAIPLPLGHSLESVSFTDDANLTNFLERLQDISQQHAEWATAIGLSIQLYTGQSLHLHDPPIP
jgi:hypothetical protein